MKAVNMREREISLIQALLKMLLPRWGGGGEVLSVVNSSNDEDSEESESLFGVEVLNGSPTFSDNNDQMADLPMDNEVSKYSFYSHLSHYGRLQDQ